MRRSSLALLPLAAVGALVAFRHRVVFIPFKDGKATGEYVTVATGTADVQSIRPAGVAVAPDGSALYIADEKNGKIYRVIPTPK